MPVKRSSAMLKALQKAAARKSGKVTPIVGTTVRSTMRTVHAMDRAGYVRWEGPHPYITDAGRAVVEARV